MFIVNREMEFLWNKLAFREKHADFNLIFRQNRCWLLKNFILILKGDPIRIFCVVSVSIVINKTQRCCIIIFEIELSESEEIENSHYNLNIFMISSVDKGIV
jgi:hypothetical protein